MSSAERAADEVLRCLATSPRFQDMTVSDALAELALNGALPAPSLHEALRLAESLDSLLPHTGASVTMIGEAYKHRFREIDATMSALLRVLRGAKAGGAK